MKKVNIFDTTLRDGEQVIGYLMDNPHKIAVLTIIDRLSLDVIELGMPYSSKCQQEFFSQLAEISPHSRIERLGVGSDFHLKKSSLEKH